MLPPHAPSATANHHRAMPSNIESTLMMGFQWVEYATSSGDSTPHSSRSPKLGWLRLEIRRHYHWNDG